MSDHAHPPPQTISSNPTPPHHPTKPQVESIILSIISMLSSPNDESPANVDAAKQWREDRDGFKKRVGRIVRKSQEML
jgi:ubiquitin-protein ligase